MARHGFRTTLAREAAIAGIGVHSGAPARALVRPAAPGSGIVFRRSDAAGARDIPAHVDQVRDTRLGTTLGDPARDGIMTIEHFLAGVYGAGIDDVRVEIDGPELPILDGSSAGYVAALKAAGVAVTDMPRTVLRVIAPVTVEAGGAHATLLPADAPGLTLDVTIEFDHPAIGRSTWSGAAGPEPFAAELAPARTFGFLADLDRLHAMGRGQGASLDNVVALDDHAIVNPEGLRMPDEFVRHKCLDVVGDLMLAGAPVHGLCRAERPGHALTVALVRALLARPACFVRDGG